MDIPSEADWRSEIWGVDTPCAYENFFGKNLEESVRLFEDNALYYQEDIMFMPLRCFRYYVLAYIRYLLSEASREDSAGANCFFGIVEIREDEIRNSDSSVISEIVRTLRRLRDNQDWYDACEEIYGSFRERASKCLALIETEPDG